jgi:hypothetical protein
LSAGFIRFVSSTNATQATGFRLFPRWDSPPTEHASLSLVALCSKNSNVLTVKEHMMVRFDEEEPIGSPASVRDRDGKSAASAAE